MSNQHNDDGLLSAALDGHATGEELRRIGDDPAAAARLAELRAARDALASAPVTAVDPARRDEAIAAALDAMPVVDLGARRPRWLVPASIAAALLAVLGVAGALALANHRDRTTTTSAAASSVASAPEASAAGAAETRAAAPAGGTIVLGSYGDRAALAAAVHQAMSAASADAATTFSNAQRSAVTPPSPCGDHTDVRVAATATLAGQPVLVFVYGPGDHPTLEVDDLSCAVLFTQPL